MSIIVRLCICRGFVVNVPAARDKYPKTYSVLEDLTNESNTWRLMGKVRGRRMAVTRQQLRNNLSWRKVVIPTCVPDPD